MLLSILWSWEEDPKEVTILQFYWSGNSGDGLPIIRLKCSIGICQ